MANGSTLDAKGGGRRTTSALNDVNNDTGRIAFCGPFVISAITGHPVSKIEDEIRAHRDVPEDQKPIVVGTYGDEVGHALMRYGYRMTMIESYMHEERKARPTLWSWMQKPRNDWASYILAIHKGKEGHWVLIKGVKLCDTFTEGRWQFVCDGPHRGCRIMEIYEVRRDRSLDL